jgi:hypothetical protein
MKRGSWVLAIGMVLGSYTAGAQTFTLKPVKLLSAVKTTYLPPASTPVYPVNIMAPDTYYRQHFGFFCKQEWTLQKRTGLAVKVRLGSFPYAQRQEGKY